MELNYADLYADLENYVPSISAAELMDAPVKPTEYVVKELLPKGLSILGGAPKVGKSWLVLDLRGVRGKRGVSPPVGLCALFREE